MVKSIMKDEFFLQMKSETATLSDLNVVEDLRDTFAANKEHCVGMAANMIGISKNIIIFDNDGESMVMLNPKIIRQKDAYSTEENCLSLAGSRKTKRYKTIKVEYQDETLQTKFKTFSGWTAQIIQHEIDHCNGVLI